MSELLVVSITWYYTYQGYRIRKGIELGKTISSLLFYNGSGYFLCLTTFYLVDIVLNTVPVEVRQVVAPFLDEFLDPIVSILTCRFMLALRQFDRTVVETTGSGIGPQFREHMASTVLQFSAQPSESLPDLIVSFAHPVLVDSDQFKQGPDSAIVDNQSERREIGTVAPASPKVPSNRYSPDSESPTLRPSSQPDEWAGFA
ncbi:hypothetical protein GSI_04965 [Ganoderma sinense ZZ0214-1]|uniref:Uncharacterized protein n=1 Tax=Ganoderma sinense ZZ0214-1 TaxID=1077348 RepID=A0A2G8SH06_9APHY|nr:hypothetical protein GSI_04965 [Ganoderma sinense ZZ0214-1]